MPASLHLTCPHCHAVNRLDAERLGDPAGRCGKCHQAFFNGTPTEISSEEQFNRHIQRNDIPVVVDFWAPWCGPCRIMGPAFAQVARQTEPRARFLKVDTEAQPSVAATYGIRSIPTLIVFHDGREIARSSGAMEASRLAAWLAPHLQHR